MTLKNTMTIFLLLTSILVLPSCKANTPSNNKDNMVAHRILVSTGQINKHFASQGYKKDFWPYGGPIRIQYNSENSTYYLQSPIYENIYGLSPSGKITPIKKVFSGINIVGRNGTIDFGSSEDGGLHFYLGQQGKIYTERGEIMFVYGVSGRYIARRKYASGKDVFLCDSTDPKVYSIIDLSTLNTIVHGEGDIIYLNSNEKQIFYLTLDTSQSNSFYTFRIFDLNKSSLTTEIKILPPAEQKDGDAFGFLGFNSNELELTFMTYKPYRHFFSKKYFFRYNVKKHCYEKPLKIQPKYKGNVYEMYMIDGVFESLVSQTGELKGSRGELKGPKLLTF